MEQAAATSTEPGAAPGPSPAGRIDEFDIGEVIERTAIAASTLHLWERHGLIRATGRVGLRRQYPSDIFERLAFVVVCQRAHFTLNEIVHLMTDLENGTKARLQEQLDKLLARRSQIDEAIDGLRHAIHCPEPHPYDCPGLQAKLAGVFQVPNSRHTA
jgi:DNA-binding transcriptional MerR regulator